MSVRSVAADEGGDLVGDRAAVEQVQDLLAAPIGNPVRASGKHRSLPVADNAGKRTSPTLSGARPGGSLMVPGSSRRNVEQVDRLAWLERDDLVEADGRASEIDRWAGKAAPSSRVELAA